MMRIEADNWYYSPEHGKLCRVIETQTLWGLTTGVRLDGSTGSGWTLL